MQRIWIVGLILCLSVPLLTAIPATAHHKGIHGKRTTMSYYRAPRPRAYGYVVRRPVGFYSYTARDIINTFGDSRTRYGSTNVFRDPMTDRQTPFGPFDHGFFFDSPNAPRGGYSPYQQ